MSTEEEGFLNRWSRRKQAAAKDTVEHPVEQRNEAVSDEVTRETPNAEEEFDVSTLPPIESINAGTDISAFLSKGVPAALVQAALRRAWSADPAIRDYIGLSEYSWDFNSPGQFGFGELDPSINVQEMVADAFGKVKEAVAKTEKLADTTSEASEIEPSAKAPSSEPPRSVELRNEKMESAGSQGEKQNAQVQGGDKIAQAAAAPQQPDEAEREIPLQPRRHGSALPS